MSTIYVLEPPTRGKVIVKTSHGPLDIELWPKEAPKAVRNFVQLCLEGYYDNTIFHRIIKSFMVQGGDPTGSGTGGESIYGSVFSDEFHSRLRFKHRGLVACANAGSPHSNGSQFFMTLDRCDWLDRKHTIFGKVTGDSIFNLLRLGEIETDKNDRPVDPPPRIISVEVLWNPFDDIIPRQATTKSLSRTTTDSETKDQKKKAVKNLNLLSFGEEAEEDEKELEAVKHKHKLKSSHDVLNDPRLLKEDPSNKELNPTEVRKKRDLQLSVREALSSKKDESSLMQVENDPSSSNDLSDEDEAQFDVRMRLQILKKRQEFGDLPVRQSLRDESSSPVRQHRDSPPRADNKGLDDEPKVEKLSIKKKGLGSEARAELMAKADPDLQLMDQTEKVRQLQKQKKRRIQGRQEEVLAKLEKFKKSLSTKHETSKDASGGDEGDELSGWTATRLKFAPETKNGMARNDDPNEYVVHDPLLEKGKEKFNKMQAKLKRRDREWAGKSLT